MTAPGFNITDLINSLKATLGTSTPGGLSDELAAEYIRASGQQGSQAVQSAVQLALQQQQNQLRAQELMGTSGAIDPRTGTPDMTDSARRWREELQAQQGVQNQRLSQELAGLTGYVDPTYQGGSGNIGGYGYNDANSFKAALQSARQAGTYTGGQTLAERQRQDTNTQAAAERALRTQLQESQQGFQAGESAAERASRLALQQGQQAFQGQESLYERQLREKLQAGQLTQQESEFARNYLNQRAALGGYMLDENGNSTGQLTEAGRAARSAEAARMAELSGQLEGGGLTEESRAAREGERNQRASLAAQLLSAPKDVFKAGAFFRSLGGSAGNMMGMGGGGIAGFNSMANRMATPGTVSLEDVERQAGGAMGQGSNATTLSMAGGATPGAAQTGSAAAAPVTQDQQAAASGQANPQADAMAKLLGTGSAATPSQPDPAMAQLAGVVPATDEQNASAAATPPADDEQPIPGSQPGGPVGEGGQERERGRGRRRRRREGQLTEDPAELLRAAMSGQQAQGATQAAQPAQQLRQALGLDQEQRARGKKRSADQQQPQAAAPTDEMARLQEVLGTAQGGGTTDAAARQQAELAQMVAQQQQIQGGGGMTEQNRLAAMPALGGTDQQAAALTQLQGALGGAGVTDEAAQREALTRQAQTMQAQLSGLAAPPAQLDPAMAQLQGILPAGNDQISAAVMNADPNAAANRWRNELATQQGVQQQRMGGDLQQLLQNFQGPAAATTEMERSLTPSNAPQLSTDWLSALTGRLGAAQTEMGRLQTPQIPQQPGTDWMSSLMGQTGAPSAKDEMMRTALGQAAAPQPSTDWASTLGGQTGGGMGEDEKMRSALSSTTPQNAEWGSATTGQTGTGMGEDEKMRSALSSATSDWGSATTGTPSSGMAEDEKLRSATSMDAASPGMSPGGPVGDIVAAGLGDLGLGGGGNFTGRVQPSSVTDAIPYVDPRVLEEPELQAMFRDMRQQGVREAAANRAASSGVRPSGPGGPTGRTGKPAGPGPHRFGQKTAEGRRNSSERMLLGLNRILQKASIPGTQPGGPVDAPLWPADGGDAAMPSLQDPGSLGSGGGSFQAPSPSASPIASVDQGNQQAALDEMKYRLAQGPGSMGPQTLERMSGTQRGVMEGALEALGLRPEDFSEAYAQTRFANVGNVLSA